MLGPLPVSALRVWEATSPWTLGAPWVAALLLGAAGGVLLLVRRIVLGRRGSNTAPPAGADASTAPGTRALAPTGGRPSGSSAVQVGAVLSRLDVALTPLLGDAISLDVLNASAGRPLLEPDRLEQVLVQLALTVRDGMDGGIVTMRAYDGLGDVTRGDGRRTWTIIEVGKVDAPPNMPLGPRVPAATEQGLRHVHQIVDEVGGRLAMEQRVPGNSYFVLQLPSIAA